MFLQMNHFRIMYIQNISSIVANLPKYSARNCLARMFLAQQLVAMVQSPARDPPTQGGAPAGGISSSVLHLLCYVEADLGWAPDLADDGLVLALHLHAWVDLRWGRVPGRAGSPRYASADGLLTLSNLLCAPHAHVTSIAAKVCV